MGRAKGQDRDGVYRLARLSLASSLNLLHFGPVPMSAVVCVSLSEPIAISYDICPLLSSPLFFLKGSESAAAYQQSHSSAD